MARHDNQEQLRRPLAQGDQHATESRLFAGKSAPRQHNRGRVANVHPPEQRPEFQRARRFRHSKIEFQAARAMQRLATHPERVPLFHVLGFLDADPLQHPKKRPHPAPPFSEPAFGTRAQPGIDDRDRDRAAATFAHHVGPEFLVHHHHLGGLDQIKRAANNRGQIQRVINQLQPAPTLGDLLAGDGIPRRSRGGDQDLRSRLGRLDCSGQFDPHHHLAHAHRVNPDPPAIA